MLTAWRIYMPEPVRSGDERMVQLAYKSWRRTTEIDTPQLRDELRPH